MTDNLKTSDAPSVSRYTNELVVPVAEERVSVTTARRVSERVLVTKTVHSRDVELTAPSTHEVVHVERVPIGKYLDAPPTARVEGDVTVVPVVEEEVVLVKRYLVREEVRIRKERTTEERTLRTRVRSERVAVERKR